MRSCFTLSLFRQAALLFAVTVKILVHQQSHFVVCFELRGTPDRTLRSSPALRRASRSWLLQP
jgi:hypothetical protein